MRAYSVKRYIKKMLLSTMQKYRAGGELSSGALVSDAGSSLDCDVSLILNHL